MKAKYVVEDPLVQITMSKSQAGVLKKFFSCTSKENIGEVVKYSSYNDEDTCREIDDTVDELYDALYDLS